MPPETQLSTSTPSSPPSPPSPPGTVGPARMSTEFAELILDHAPSEEFFGASSCRCSRIPAPQEAGLWLAEVREAKTQPPTFLLESFVDLSKFGFNFGFNPLTPGVLSVPSAGLHDPAETGRLSDQGDGWSKRASPTRTRRHLPGFSATASISAEG